MKRKFSAPAVRTEPTEAEIRDYARHLYQESGGLTGHDLDHWLEAEACLSARIPKHRSDARLHSHFLGLVDDDVCTTEPGLKILPL